ncbi:hypothetical protein GCM10011314_06030 [Knoellia flava]|uniref:HIRAN domain-containing protein n=1 Tax=Knoellia flava TaxID=913969 RepID=A0A8H9FRB5_9MICO|nr:hypothetical protein GCM10011314_06030 [Knoellia flava]
MGLSGAKSASRPRKARYQTAAPSGLPVEPWARATTWQNVVGESHYENAFRALLDKNKPPWGDYWAEMDDLPAAIVADPDNPHDSSAVAVWVQEELVGFLPREAAALYHPALADLAERGEHLRVGARVLVHLDDGAVSGSATVTLPPPEGVQSYNEPPDEPHQVMPHGSAMQVTCEEQHMDVLGAYVSDRERHVAVTLHAIDVQKTPRSSPYRAVEVRLDGQRVGELTKGMSEKMLDVVDFISGKGRLPLCRAVLKGSPLRAELTLQVAKAHEVKSRWLDGIESA